MDFIDKLADSSRILNTNLFTEVIIIHVILKLKNLFLLISKMRCYNKNFKIKY